MKNKPNKEWEATHQLVASIKQQLLEEPYDVDYFFDLLIEKVYGHEVDMDKFSKLIESSPFSKCSEEVEL